MTTPFASPPLAGPVVAIDGPSGAGKSTVARALAGRLGWGYLDTGATYRAAAVWCRRTGVDLEDAGAVAGAIAAMPLDISTDPADPRVRLAADDVTAAIRSAAVSTVVSKIATNLSARRLLGQLQRDLLAAGRVVAEGRDITTVVAPDAAVRVLVTATPDARLRRRALEVSGSADAAALDATRDQVLRRDADDSTVVEFQRAADGVVLLDTSELTVDEVVDRLVALVGRPGLSERAAARREQKAPTAWGPRWSRWVGLFLAKVVWNTKVVGARTVPKRGPVLLAVNHTGVIDGPLVHGVVPRGSHFLVKREFFESRLGFLMRWSGQIYTDRRDGRPALAAALAVLRRGGVVGVFPEGFRGRGRVEHVKAGIGWLQAQSGAPVVPVAVLGTRSTGQKVGHVPGFRAKLYVEFGEPFTPQRPDGTSGREFVGVSAEEIRVRLAEHVTRAERHSGLLLPDDGPNGQGEV